MVPPIVIGLQRTDGRIVDQIHLFNRSSQLFKILSERTFA